MTTLCTFLVFVFNLWLCKELSFNKYYFNLFTSFTCFSILTLVAFFSKKKLFKLNKIHLEMKQNIILQNLKFFYTGQ